MALTLRVPCQIHLINLLNDCLSVVTVDKKLHLFGLKLDRAGASGERVRLQGQHLIGHKDDLAELNWERPKAKPVKSLIQMAACRPMAGERGVSVLLQTMANNEQPSPASLSPPVTSR